MKFRTLKANEIECRVGQCKENGCSLLLYKDARVDMNLLDETVGSMNWKREHMVVNNNLYCTVSIWDENKKEWVSKQDVGTESNTEAIKGESSDSFKRACFNIGIGRELYTAPFIWIKLEKDEVRGANGRFNLSSNVKFSVTEIDYNDNREISKLIISDGKKNRYTFGSKEVDKPKEKKPKAEPTIATIVGETVEDLFSDTRLMAIQEINGAQTIDSLLQVYNTYVSSLGKDTMFMSALSQRKEKLLNGAKK